jgi:hypothetical protein
MSDPKLLETPNGNYAAAFMFIEDSGRGMRGAMKFPIKPWLSWKPLDILRNIE